MARHRGPARNRNIYFMGYQYYYLFYTPGTRPALFCLNPPGSAKDRAGLRRPPRCSSDPAGEATGEREPGGAGAGAAGKEARSPALAPRPARETRRESGEEKRGEGLLVSVHSQLTFRSAAHTDRAGRRRPSSPAGRGQPPPARPAPGRCQSPGPRRLEARPAVCVPSS